MGRFSREKRGHWEFINALTRRAYFRGVDKDPNLDRHLYWQAIYETYERKVFMRTNFYESYKNLYESVKPIRGRAEDVRPIGQRRRDWETIEKRGDNYACRLYNTDVVTYYPDGSIGLRADTWSTPLTADFMHEHSPFYVYKRYKKLWVRVRGVEKADDKHYPIPSEGELRMVKDCEISGYIYYKPSEPVVIQQRVVDRTKAKAGRENLKGFLDWAKMFMKLSDGWIMHDTRVEFCTKVETDHWRMKYHYKLPEGLIYQNYYRVVFDTNKMYEYLSTCDADGYLPALLAILSDRDKAVEKRLVKQMEHRYEGSHNVSTVNVYDLQYTYDFLKRQVYAIADQNNDIHKVVEVGIDDKALTNVI